MNAKMNQLQATTFGLFLALSAPTDAKSEAALSETAKIADGLAEDELEYAKSIADALASALKSCFFGCTKDGAVAAFFTLPELNKFLQCTAGSRVATTDEAFDFAANKAQAVVFQPA